MNLRLSLLRITPIIASLLIAWFHLFSGTSLTFVAVVAVQFFYGGFLLARVLGQGQQGHPFWRFAWVLASAFGLNIVLGGFSRLLLVPVSHYTLAFHGILLILALLPARTATPAPVWKAGRHNIANLLLITFCCIVVLGVGLARNQVRFDGYEDQTVFVELADWLASEPEDRSIDGRRVGVPSGATRWDFDGWTYTHAVWAWSSGVSASQIIWFNLTWLLVWTVPVAIFGLAYALTQKESAATWSVVALTLFGLMTIDSLGTYNSTLAFGQFSLFQMNSLRTFATALLTPLALMVMLAYVRKPAWPTLLLSLLVGIAVGMSHARPAMTLIYTVGATVALWWLAHPSRSRFVTSGLLVAVLFVVLVLPIVQKPPALLSVAVPAVDGTGNQPSTVPSDAATATTESSIVPTPTETPLESVEPVETTDPAIESDLIMSEAVEDVATAPDPRGELLRLHLPLLGDTFIVNPRGIFYHPAIIAAVVLGLAAGVLWRHSLAAAFSFASTLTTLIFLFTPGITPIMTRLTSDTVIASLIFAVPVPIILGLAVNALLERIANARRFRVSVHLLACLFATLTILMLLFEPVPIPASARDQIHTSNAIQGIRAMRQSDERLVAAVRDIIPPNTSTVFLTPHRVANFISEDVPLAMITGGRHQNNEAFDGTTRFFTESRRMMPWLDTTDLEYLKTWSVTHIVVEADDTRVPQLIFSPERFALRTTSDGYLVFEVSGTLEPDAVDELFDRMNAVYSEQSEQRWSRDGLNTLIPGNPAIWEPLIEQWNQLPENETTLLGMAFANTLAGNDTTALEQWQRLSSQHPDVAFFIPALAGAQFSTQGANAAKETLISMLDSATPTVQILAARTLLSEYYFYLLDNDNLDQLLDKAVIHPVIWDQLAVYNRNDEVREHVTLLLSRQRWDAAEHWHQALRDPQMDARDYVTRASIALVQGNIERALAILAPATDPDYTLANRALHPDRWQNNAALNLALMLRAAQAERNGDLQTASTLYRSLDLPTDRQWIMDYLAGDNATRQFILEQLPLADDENIVDFDLPLTIADNGRLYMANTTIEPVTPNQIRLTVSFGNAHVQPFPVEQWVVQIVNADTLETYAEVSRPAINLEPLLTRTAFIIDLPAAVPPDTPGLAVIKAMHDERVVLDIAYIPVTLNPSVVAAE